MKKNLKLKARIVEHFGCQADFAEAMRVREDFLSRAVNGRRKIPDEMKREWARALNCEPIEIFPYGG